jgi:Zn-dependent protease with chaperone function
LGTAGHFAWWDTHNRAWRRARFLFGLAVVVVAVYVAGLLAIVVVVLRAAGVGPWARIDTWFDGDPVLRSTIMGIAVLAFAVLVIAAIGWRGLSNVTVRFSRARPPAPDEDQQLRGVVASCALAYGMSPPRVWVIDDAAPNAMVFGRPAVGHLCMTTGALGLPPDEIEALCMFHIAALASRVFAYATSAADLVLLGEWCTRMLWTTGFVAVLSPAVGVPIWVAVGYMVGLFVLVAITRPMLFVADRGLVKLLDESAELIDLEAVRQTVQPAPFARLLLDLVEDQRRALSRWEIAHLWFERDVVDFVDNRNSLTQSLANAPFGDIGTPAFAGRCMSGTRRSLLERAQIAVNLANGDAKLRARLSRARAEMPRV